MAQVIIAVPRLALPDGIDASDTEAGSQPLGGDPLLGNEDDGAMPEPSGPRFKQRSALHIAHAQKARSKKCAKAREL